MALQIFWLSVLALFIDFCCCSSELKVVKEPSSSTFPLEGSKFTVKCLVYGTNNLPNATFQDVSNKIIKDSADGHRKFTKEVDGFNEVLTLTWDPVRLTDTELSDLSCHVGDTNYKYNVHIIPAKNEPVIDLSPTNETVNKDDDITLTCDIQVKMIANWASFALEWLFNGELVDTSLKKKYEMKMLVDETGNKSSTLTVSKMTDKDEGVYKCRANIMLISGYKTESTFAEDAKILVKWDDASTPQKQEFIKMNEEKVEMACMIKGYPVPDLHWRKGDNIIKADVDKRYSFSNNTEYGTENSLFTISKVTYTDRGKYYCVATFPSGKSSRQEFILRVRDPLGALWPAIGILIEAVLLFLIIGLYTCCKKSKHQSNEDDVDGANHEKTPLVKDTPRVSYSTGDDGVKSRLVNNEIA